MLLCLTIGNTVCQQSSSVATSAQTTICDMHACLLLQETEQRERAKRANLETRQANEVLQKFKQLEVEREKEAMAAIEGEAGTVISWKPGGQLRFAGGHD